MQNFYNTVIIGGGASGLMCAVELLSGKNRLSGSDVIILERNDRVGKKLVATGNGQGNLTNQNLGCEFFHGDKSFIDGFLSSEKEIDLCKYLEKLGIPLTALKDGKIYPLSRQASAVLDVLRAFIAHYGCQEKTGAEVDSIVKSGNLFKVRANGVEHLAKNVVFAVGGKAGKQFGTDGSAYKLIEKFGHSCSDLYPSLVQLKTDTTLIKGLKGLKETALVTAIVNGKKVKSATGDLLFTEFGVSGSTVFSVSSAVASASSAQLKIEFLPEKSQDEIEQILTDKLNMPFVKKEDVLVGVINKRIGQAVLKTVKDFTPKAIAKALKNFNLNVQGTLGFNYAQVTRGGIKTDSVDVKTMQSKNVPNLYIVGEVLDVDGDCGGYNLTFAFVTGIVCARHVKSKTE